MFKEVGIIFGFVISSLWIYTIIKIYFVKKSIREIRKQLKEILQADTNQVLIITTSDKDVQRLASDLNQELKLLRKEQLQYQTGNQELKKIITNISHDMRTPLTAIKGYMDLIKENKEKQQRYIQIIERKVEELTLLTEQLFDFSKTMDMGTKIQKENCCINEILEETLANAYFLFKQKEIEPVVRICNESIYRILDKQSFIRILENIISNVCKYSSGDFIVALNKEGMITFSNKASSLDAMTVQKIFDRYFTVENAKKSTGLGLSIAKQLVELNGGTIMANYEKGYLIIKMQF